MESTIVRKILYMVVLLPILCLLDIMAINQLFVLISAPSDVAVFLGVSLSGCFIVSNILLFRLIIKFLKTKTK